MKSITLKTQPKEKYPLSISYDFIYQILNENDIPIGVVFLSETMDDEVYIEWLEILTNFRGCGYLRLIFKELSSRFGCDIHLQSGEELLKKYTSIGCEEHGIDEITEMYSLIYKRK